MSISFMFFQSQKQILSFKISLEPGKTLKFTGPLLLFGSSSESVQLARIVVFA